MPADDLVQKGSPEPIFCLDWDLSICVQAPHGYLRVPPLQKASSVLPVEGAVLACLIPSPQVAKVQLKLSSSVSSSHGSIPSTSFSLALTNAIFSHSCLFRALLQGSFSVPVILLVSPMLYLLLLVPAGKQQLPVSALQPFHSFLCC